MKSSAVIPLALLCAVVICGLAMAGGSSGSSDLGVFLRPDASCPPANFALYGACPTIVSTNPVICDYPLIGYGIVSKSLTKKLDRIGYFVALRGTFVGEVCGKKLFRFRNRHPIISLRVQNHKRCFDLMRISQWRIFP